MESTPIKVENGEGKQTFDPWLDLKDALDELKIDYRSPDFTEERMLARF